MSATTIPRGGCTMPAGSAPAVHEQELRRLRAAAGRDGGRPARGPAGGWRSDRAVGHLGAAGTGHRGAVHRLVGCRPGAPCRSISGCARTRRPTRWSVRGGPGGGAGGVFPSRAAAPADRRAQGLAWCGAAGETARSGRSRRCGSGPPVLVVIARPPKRAAVSVGGVELTPCRPASYGRASPSAIWRNTGRPWPRRPCPGSPRRPLAIGTLSRWDQRQGALFPEERPRLHAGRDPGGEDGQAALPRHR